MAIASIISIGGCAGCVYLMSKAAMDIPDYATADYFESNYGKDVRKITEKLKAGEDLSHRATGNGFDEDVVAVLLLKEEPGATPDFTTTVYVDLYKRHEHVDHRAHTLRGNHGVVRLQVDTTEADYLTQQILVGEAQYWVCFQTRENRSENRPSATSVAAVSPQKASEQQQDAIPSIQQTNASQSDDNQVVESAQSRPARLWTNRKGKSSQAYLVAVYGDTVELQSVKTGKSHRIKIADLVEEDQTFIALHAGSDPAVQSPNLLSGKSRRGIMENFDGSVLTIRFSKHRHADLIPDKVHRAYTFNGESSYVQLSESFPKHLADRDFSVSFEMMPAAQRQQTSYIIEHHRDYPWTGLFVAIHDNKNLRFRLKDHPQNSIMHDISGIIGDGRYHHVVVSRRDRRLEMYIDGSLKVSEVQPEHVNLDIDYNTNLLTIGTHCELRYPQYYSGGLRRMVFFIGRSLTQDEVRKMAL